MYTLRYRCIHLDIDTDICIHVYMYICKRPTDTKRQTESGWKPKGDLAYSWQDMIPKEPYTYQNKYQKRPAKKRISRDGLDFSKRDMISNETYTYQKRPAQETYQKTFWYWQRD